MFKAEMHDFPYVAALKTTANTAEQLLVYIVCYVISLSLMESTILQRRILWTEPGKLNANNLLSGVT